MRQSIRAGKVVVGDDEIDARAPRALGRGKGTSAGIDADDQSNAAGGGAFDHISAQVVAFANPVRHVEIRRASAEFDRGFQDHDGGGAIDVVVAIDENSLFAFDGALRVGRLPYSFPSSTKVNEADRVKAREKRAAASGVSIPRSRSSLATACGGMPKILETDRARRWRPPTP